MPDKAKYKVLFLCAYKSLYGGNFVPSLMALESGLKGKMECVYAFPMDAKDRAWIKYLQDAGKKIIFFDFDVGRIEFISQLNQVVKDNNITHVHSHFAPILKVELYSLIHKKVKVFIHIHSDFSAGNSSLKLRAKLSLMYKIFSVKVKFFSVSKAFVAYNPKRISWVPNALANQRIECERVGGEAIRQQHGIAENDVFCEIFGWSPVVKGVDIAMNAVKILNEQKEIPLKLGIVCGREMTADKMRVWIKANTACNGDEAYLKYLLPREDVFSYHEAADLLLSASRSEGFPYSILEMLSLGKRCVVSDILGVKWAKKYETTYCFKSESVKECVAAIQKALDENKKFDKSVANAVRQDYSMDTWVDTIISGYGIS